MHAAADRPEFAPPPQPGLVRAFALAVLAHLLLIVALTFGLRWQRDATLTVAEAELWAAVPQEVAPRPEPPAPPPPRQPEPQQPVQPPPAPEPPVRNQPDIALEREQQQKREAEKRRLAEEREQKKREAEKRRLAEEREERERKLEAQKKREAEELARKKQEQAREVAEAKKKEEEKKRKEQEAREAREAKRLAEQREENLKRMQGMAGTGAPGSGGSAAQAAGPSGGWASKVQARVRPHIVFTADVSGNPKAEVEVRTSPDGTIVGKRLVRSSGSKAWDEAVLRALERAESLPRDIDGRVPSPVVIEFRPRG